MHIEDVGLDWYVRRLEDAQPFAFVRYGDGEFKTMLGNNLRGGHIVLGEHRRCEEAREPLLESLESHTGDPDYLRGLQRLALKRFGDSIPEQRWVAADVLHDAARDGRLRPLLSALQAHRCLVVGPQRLARLRELIPVTGHVVIPDSDCFDARADISAMLAEALQARPSAVLLSCGILAKVLVSDLYDGAAAWIDAGSLWDGFWFPSRKYQRQMSPETRQRNLAG